MKPATFQPEKALIMYKLDDLYYFEAYDIEKAKRGHKLMEGHPLTQDDLIKMTKVAVESSKNSEQTILGGIPSNLLYLDIPLCLRMAWWIPQSKRKMKFKGMEIKSTTCMIPPLLFVKNSTSLHIYGLKENKRPEGSTGLFHAPLHNVYHDGQVCMGNVTTRRIVKLKQIETQMTAWEKAFFDSDFSHHGSVLFDGDILKTYKAIEKTKKVFPVDKMISAKLILADVL